MSNALPKRHEVPISLTWDTSLLYDSFETYKIALDVFIEKVNAFNQQYKGNLTSAETIVAALQQYEALLKENLQLSVYVYLNQDVDNTSAERAAQANTYHLASEHIWPSLVFVVNELIQQPQNVLEKVSATNQHFAPFIKKCLHQKEATLDPEKEELLAAFLPTLQQPYEMYRTIKFEDMIFDSFEADGQTYANSYVLFENDYEAHENKEVRYQAAKSFYRTLRQHKNATATAYLAQVKQEQIQARLRGFQSTIDYLLHEQNVSHELFDRQIDVIMKELAPHMRRFVKLVAKQHQLDKITEADLKISLISSYQSHITPEEARALLKDCLSVLGNDYVAMIERAFDERWIDFAQNEGKSTGGYCSTLHGGPAYILLNWNGSMSEALVLAHELGHAGHFVLASKQSFLNYDPSLYFIEAPSTANEILTCNYLLQQNDDPEFQAYLISELISRTYFHNMVTHLLEAAFQREVYTRMDNGDYLNADILCEIKRTLLQTFWGPDVEISEDAGFIWMRQPHYYMGLYPYTYSAGLTIGTVMAQTLAKNPEEVVERWLETLSLGSVLSAQELALHAGVDVSTEQPLRDTIAYVGSLVDKLETLVSND